MTESVEDLAVPWTLHSPRLARTILAYADSIEWRTPTTFAVATELRAIVRCELNPLDDQLPPLGAPPTVRPAVPPGPLKPEAGS